MKKQLFSFTLTLVFLGSLLTTFTWYMAEDNNIILRPTPKRKRAPKTYDLCEGCKEVIEGIMQRYSKTWQKQEDNYQQFRSQLRSSCNGFDNSTLTQASTPIGSEIFYKGDNKKTVKVNSELFHLFTKEHPFLRKSRDTCAVIGNGGILADSGCGEMIDSAQFVIRCNLPPLENGYEKDVGVKTDLVTINPTILNKKYEGLMKYRRPFVEDLRKYGRSLVLLGPFSLAAFTAVSLRAAYTIEDFGGPTQSILLNPEYHRCLGVFWRKQGLKERRLTTGIMMVSLALELCENVHLFGFWPFNNHPHGLHNLKHHYYDDVQPKTNFHSMPAEFELLLQLHNQGVLRLHLEDCQTERK